MIDSLIDFERLHAIGMTAQILQQLRRLPPLQGEPCVLRVTEVQRDGLSLHDGECEHAARALPSLLQALRAQGDALAVGDWVLAERFPHDEWWVHTRMPPLTQIARRLHDGREKVTRTVMVSNVDTALLVMGLDLDFSLRRLERYLALARLSGVPAVVVLTKADTCADVPARLDAVRSVLALGTGVVAVDARDARSRHALAAWLGPGRTLVLLGSSGAGKSTLTNTLIGREAQATGAARRRPRPAHDELTLPALHARRCVHHRHAGAAHAAARRRRGCAGGGIRRCRRTHDAVPLSRLPARA